VTFAEQIVELCSAARVAEPSGYFAEEHQDSGHKHVPRKICKTVCGKPLKFFTSLLVASQHEGNMRPAGTVQESVPRLRISLFGRGYNLFHLGRSSLYVPQAMHKRIETLRRNNFIHLLTESESFQHQSFGLFESPQELRMCALDEC
jgi:hypothetical protein